MKKLFCIIFLFSSLGKLNAQQYCGTAKLMRLAGPSNYYKQLFKSYQQSTTKARNSFTIPVVVHVVYNSSVENIPDSIIHQQIDILNNDFNRWNTLKNTWYKTGVAYNKLDSLDGEVNKLWNTYMQHPSYDDYWKKMIPYKEEFAKIDIPILTITGYYDDSQRGAMYYYNQHHKYAKNPNHYLLIGPYDHWTAQSKPQESLRNYKLDKSALINIEEDIIYQWFDYVLNGKEKPSILKVPRSI